MSAGYLSSNMPQRTILQTSLDSAASISTPVVGSAGTVKNIAFATGHMGKGVRPVVQERFVSFPQSNIDMECGRVEFWYKPINALDTTSGDHHVLLSVGSSTSTKMLLDWDDVLRFSIADAGGAVRSVETMRGEKLWAKGGWVNIAVEWDSTDRDDGMRIMVGDVRKGVAPITGGWIPASLPADAAIFIGCMGRLGTLFADGTIDELLITTSDDPIIIDPLPPPPTTTKSGLAEAPDQTGPVGRSPAGARLSVAAFTRPAPGTTTVDATFGTTIRAMTPGSVHEYSQLQSFTDDGEFVLLIETDGYAIRRYSDLSLVKKAWWTSPAWLPGTHKLLVIEGDPVRYFTVDADVGGTQTLHMTLPQFRYASGARSHESPSLDGRWTALYVNNDGQGGQWVCAVDLLNKRLGAVRALRDIQSVDPEWGLIEPDWVGVSPMGRYLTVQQLSGGKGLELYDIQTGAHVRHVYDHHNHSDQGVSLDGREFVATTAFTHPDNNNFPSLVVHWLDGAPMTNLRMIDWNRTDHLSCKGPRGKILVTAGGRSSGGPLGPLEGELYVASLDGSIQRLVHHRSKSSDYWMQPKASMSRDGKRIIWSTDLGTAGSRNCLVLEDLVL